MTDEKPTPHWRKLKLFLSHKDPLNKAEVRKHQASDAVSYTHLTLPTICSV